MADSEVAFFPARSELKGAVVPGIALIYPSEAAAITALMSMTAPAVEGRMLPTMFSLDPSPATGDWVFSAVAFSSLGDTRIEVSGIPDGDVRELQNALNLVLYFFVIFGYYEHDGTVELLDPSANALFKSEITIDGRSVRGQYATEVDWSNILGNEANLSLGRA